MGTMWVEALEPQQAHLEAAPLLSALLLFSPSVMSDSAHQQKLCPRTLAPALCTWLRVDSPSVAVTVKPDLGSTVPATARDTRDVGSTPGQEDPLEEGVATHSSTLAWRIPRTEEPGRLQSIGLQGVGHD